MSHITMLTRYFSNLPNGKVVLWCYLIWYINTLVHHFDPAPSIWLNSAGISLLIGIALVLSVGGLSTALADKWQTFRLFLMPFCVSSFSSLIKGKGFILIVSPSWPEAVTSVGLCAGFVAIVLWLRRNKAMNVFRTSREIPATPPVIFAAFRNPDMLARWWGPAGFTNTFNIFQFQSGGKWSFVMHGPDGTSYLNESEFVELVDTRKVVIRHVSEPIFTLTVTLEPSAKGSVVTWVQEFESEQVARNVAHIVEPSNEQNLDRLTAVTCGG